MRRPLTMLGWSLDHPQLLVGWVHGVGVQVCTSSDALLRQLRAVGADPAGQGLTDETRGAIRDLLRGNGYKPAGRGKPASEFLARAASRGELPEINAVVDINNLISLQTGWPISVFDLDVATSGGAELELRLGAPAERFVFNHAGQSIDIGGLICVARRGAAAIGNPVRDSMETKIQPATRNVLAVLYTSRAIADRESMAAAMARFSGLLVAETGAVEVETGTLPLTS